MNRRTAARARENGLVHEVLQPAGWPLPSGYVNGVAAKGRMIFTGGLIAIMPQNPLPTEADLSLNLPILVFTLAATTMMAIAARPMTDAATDRNALDGA